MTAIRDPAPKPSTATGLPQRVAPATSRPRSPSGSDWERPDAEPPGPAETADAQWDSADGDAYRPPPADTRWQPPGEGTRRRRNELSETRRPRSGSGTHRKTGGRGTDSRAAEPKAGDTGSFRSPAAHDPVWPAESAWPSDDRGWQSGDDAGWPATAGQPPWAPAAPAAEPAGDSGWPEPAAARPDPVAAAEKWQPGDGARWQPAAADAMWGPPAADREPGGDHDGEEPFGWRPSAQTETFPAIGEDS